MSESKEGPDLKSSDATISKLDMCGVTAYIKDVMTLLVENRPANPIEFMADYFRNAANGTDPLTRAHRMVRLTDPRQPAFQDNLVTAFTILRANEPSQQGISGREYGRLLRLLSADLPVEVVDPIFQALGKTYIDSIEFPSFCSGIKQCLSFEELLQIAGRLFDMCEKDLNHTIDASAAIGILRDLKEELPPEKARLLLSDEHISSVLLPMLRLPGDVLVGSGGSSSSSSISSGSSGPRLSHAEFARLLFASLTMLPTRATSALSGAK